MFAELLEETGREIDEQIQLLEHYARIRNMDAELKEKILINLKVAKHTLNLIGCLRQTESFRAKIDSRLQEARKV